jgi:hypothetical protein
MSAPKTPGTFGAAPLPPPGPGAIGNGMGALAASPAAGSILGSRSPANVPAASVGAAPRAPVTLPQGASNP